MDRLIKLPYGLKDGEVVTIDEVEPGLACGCTCLCCGSLLVAKKGRILIPHFAHYDCSDCAGVLQTGLHLLAKEIIYHSSFFTTPELLFPGTRYLIAPEALIPIHNVLLEKKLSNLIPDIIIETSNNKKLVVEIIVTNAVDNEKRKKIRAQNIASVCVYAPELLGNLFRKKNFRLTDESFEKELIEGTDYKYWINNPKLNAIQQHLRMTYAKERIVKEFEHDYGWFYYVTYCPLEKRFYKKGFKEGKPFASTENCNRCSYNVNPDDSDWTPKTILCIGHLKETLGTIINHLKQTYNL